MADSKISALTDGSPLVGTDALAIARSGTSLKVLGSSLPGSEIGYNQITSAVNITDSVESTATALITSSSLTFDGSPVICQFFGIVRCDTAAVSDALIFSLFEGSTQITRLAAVRAEQLTSADLHTINACYRFTPSAAAHTYKITAFVPSTSGTPAILGGAGGTGAQPPAFIRFTKV